MAQLIDNRGPLTQLVAYGIQNDMLCKSEKNYVLNLLEIEMELKQYNLKIKKPNSININNPHYGLEQFNHDILDEHDKQIINNKRIYKLDTPFQYEYEFCRTSDQFKIQGIIIYLDEQDEYTNQIENELHKITIDIYVWEIYKINLIGSIPLIIGKVSYVLNSVVIKLPNLFFSSDKKYFNGSFNYKFVVKSPIKLKKIFLEIIARYDDTQTRKKIYILTNVFYEQDWKYILTSSNIFEVKKNFQLNEVIYEKKLINSKEKLLGMYFVIPNELEEFISHVEFEFKTYNEIIDIDVLDTIYKIEKNDFVNLYRIFFKQPLNLEPSDLFKIKFEYCKENEAYLNSINNLMNDIYTYPIISNKLICVGGNLNLKFINGEFNETYNENEKELIKKFSNNIDALMNALCEFNKKENIINGLLKHYINETFNNFNVYREFFEEYNG